MMRMEEIREMVLLMERFASTASDRDMAIFAEDMGSVVHRTNQQRFTMLVMAWIRKLSTMDNATWSDPRNAASVQLAKDIVNTLSGSKYDINGRFFLPTI